MTLPPITQKQKEIVQHILRFRFINRIQVQKLLHHKDYHRINIWLKDLTEKQYLQRTHKKTFEGQAKPAVYNLGINGIRFLKTQEKINKNDLKKYYGESKKGEKFQKQCQFIVNVYLAITQKYNDVASFFTRADFPANGVIRDILPSFGFIREEKDNRIAYICELFQYGKPRSYYPIRIRKFINFFRDEEDTVILFICSSNGLHNYIEKITEGMLSNENLDSSIHFKTITYQGLKDMDFVSEDVNEE